jgi:cation:H+ antiporter
MASSVFLLVLGLLMLVAGGEFLVKSAVSFAQKLSVPPFLIGITVVSFGTSAPELMVSIQAAIDGASGIAIGNVIGSNIANIGLVLGVTALVKPIILIKKKIHSFLVDNGVFFNIIHLPCL